MYCRRIGRLLVRAWRSSPVCPKIAPSWAGSAMRWRTQPYADVERRQGTSTGACSIWSKIEAAGVDDDDGFVRRNLFDALQIERKTGDARDVTANGAVKRARFWRERLALDGEKRCLSQLVIDGEDAGLFAER